MARRRRTPAAAPARAVARVSAVRDREGQAKGAAMNTDNTQGVAEAGQGSDLAPETQAADLPAHAEATEGANLHETLLESVSPEAIAAHGGGEGEPSAEPTEAAATDAEPAPLAEDLTVVPDSEAEPVPFATEAVEAANTAVETATEALESVAAAVPVPVVQADTGVAVDKAPDAASILPSTGSQPGLLSGLRSFTDLAASPRIGQVMGELGEANATVLTYLRGEGTAALAHWQALSRAKTPADAIRIQVDEMQRAADASLSCLAALAKRAGRFSTLIGRH